LYTVSLADSSAIKWDKTSGTLIQEFSGTLGQQQVFSVAMSEDGQFLFIGSQDPSSLLVQRRASDGFIIRQYEGGHSSTVFTVKVMNDFLFSGDASGSIIQWVISNGNLGRRFVGKSYDCCLNVGHTFYVSDMVIVNEYLCSSARDGQLIKWKISTGEILWKFRNSDVFFSIEVYAGIVYTGLGETSFSKFNLENGTLIETVKGFCPISTS
jgi:WD40 repeat protein